MPPADSLRDEVSYAIGALENGRHQQNADAYLAFLATAAAQDAYARFGFVRPGRMNSRSSRSSESDSRGQCCNRTEAAIILPGP